MQSTVLLFSDIFKFNPYHDSLGRFASGGNATSFTYKPGASTAHTKAIEREKAKHTDTETKGFKGTLYHGSPNKDIKEFDMSRAGQNTSSGEKLLFFTDSKQMADDFSYERLDGSSKYMQRRGEKGRVYEVDVEMKNPLDFRKLSDKDIDNILKLDSEGLLTKQEIKRYAESNHQLLKAGLTLTADSLKGLGYDGLIANTGKAGHNSLEYAVVDSKQTKIRKGFNIEEVTTMNDTYEYPNEFQITKADDDKRLVFGWALVAKRSDGEQIIDHQGDIVEMEDLEESAYEYVLNFRDSGEEHIGTLRKKARMVESVVFTEEKLQAMGIPLGTVPYGWWIGFYVDDDNAWELIKNGTYQMFSIEGKAIREPVEDSVTKALRNYEEFPEYGMWLEENLDATIDEQKEAKAYYDKKKKSEVAKSFSELMKFNPYHDRLGRFTSGGGFGVSSSLYTGDPKTKAVTFSANPHTRAGALAIARHGGVVPTAYGDDYAPPKKVEKPKPKKPKVEKPKTEPPKEEPKKIESDFKPAKNKKEAIQYAKTELGFDSVSYGTKLDLETINHINKQVADIQVNYPEVKGAVQQLKTTTSKRVYAQVATDSFGGMSLEIGSHIYGRGMAQLEKEYQKDVNSGFHPKGTNAKDIIWHEYGHVIGGIHSKEKVGIAANEKISSFDKRMEFVNHRRTGGWEKEVYKQATGKEYSGSGAKDFASKISKYATSNAKELFAEAFAEFNGSENPSSECIALMKAAGIF